MSCFNCNVGAEDYLFPGKDQEERFSRILSQLLVSHENDLQILGYQVRHIGMHSIRKGAISYLSGALGGLQTAAVCVCAGWTMGKVKDIMRYVDNGDKFVGRCLALLPLLSSKFACSLPHFLATDNDHAYWDAICRAHVPMVSNIPEYSMLTRMCLASLLFHRKWIANTFPVNHIVHCSSVTLRRADIVAKFESNPNIVVVAYPWNDTSNHTYSGIPRTCR